MAEMGSFVPKQQRLGSFRVRENHQNSSKFYNQFLYKAILVSIFLLVVPFVHSQGPEFFNQRLYTTSYEILQLIFVGIAVSYGLFSKRNDVIEKDLHSSNFDNVQSYVSGLLQVSSVFDDETASPSSRYENKVQTWTSQYHRGEPMVVVAPKSPLLDQEQNGTHSRVVKKTLSLPVRSLKSRVSDPDVIEPISESNVKGVSVTRSSSSLGSKMISRTSSNSITGKLGGSMAPSPPRMEGKVEENIVLRSPIPWRSRSGRMEMKEDIENPFYSLPPSVEETKSNKIESRTFSSLSFHNSTSNTNSPPKKLSPSPSLTSEFQAQNIEEFVRKKSSRKSTLPIPPPPPPPPPPFFHKPPLIRSSTSRDKNDELFPRRDLKKSLPSVPDKLSGNNIEDLENREKTGEGTEWWTRTSSDGSIMSKYVERHAPDETLKGAAKGENFSEDFVNVNEERRVEPTLIKNRMDFVGNVRENPSFLTKQTLTDFPDDEKKKDFVEAVLVETEDEDSETDEDEDEDEDDEFEENSGYENQVLPHNSASDGGPDVDKKADEFIAKFREQIRLQRIASIRKSTGQLQKNTIR